MRPGIRLLFLGDIVGEAGRRGLLATLPALRDELHPDFVVANAENAAGGLGITPRLADSLLEAGVDALTLGNHAFRRRDVYAYLDEQERIVRPANFARGNPGRGATVVERDGLRLGVLNLCGTITMTAARSPFHEVDPALADLRKRADLVLVDLHAETTSEKVAMGWHLDGRVLAMVGTHTHVPTADARVLPGGTAYITDVGMCGPRDSVIGVKKEQVLERFVTQMPVRFEPASGDVWIMGVLIEAGADGRARSIEQVLRPALAE